MGALFCRSCPDGAELELFISSDYIIFILIYYIWIVKKTIMI